MSLFSRSDQPGPGIPEDAPRKTGLSRTWEMISRDFWAFWLAGMVNLIFLFPFIWLVGYACATHSILFALLAGILGGLIAAPSFYGLADTLLRSLRDEPGFWWHRYSRAVKRSLKSTLLPGMIFGVVFAMQFFILMHMQLLGGLGMLLCQLVSMVVSSGMLAWFLIQHALLDMKLSELSKNAILLFLRYFLKTLMASVVLLGYGLVVLQLFPNSVFLLLVVGLWLPLLVVFQSLYPTIDELFSIEDRLKDSTKS